MPETPEQRAIDAWAGVWRQISPLASPAGPIPDPTPSEGPDPYGNPDPEWLRIDWREHLRRVEIPTREYPERPPRRSSGEDVARELEGSTIVNYVDMGPLEQPGSERAIVFVHGLSGCWQNWLENIPHFCRRHRVLAPDLPGFGHSPLPHWHISIETYGRLLHDFCETLEVADAVVVGNSMGGFISAEAAISEPGRFERLVLVSAAGVSSVRMRLEPAETAARMTIAMTPLALRHEERALRRPRLRWLSFRSVFHAPDKLRSELLYEHFHNGAGKPGFLPAVRGLVGYDILDRLEEVEVPTLIVWGRDDRVVPPGDALEFGQRLRNSRTVIFDRTGHAPMAERPIRFNRVLETFLEDQAG